MKWIYLYQGVDDLCKYVSSEKPDEWQIMMYDEFIIFLSSLTINDRDNFMFYFSFIGKVLYVDLTEGAWEEVSLDTPSSFSELRGLNEKEKEEFSFMGHLKNTIKGAMITVHDKTNNLKF